jgi:hypothetical protein
LDTMNVSITNAPFLLKEFTTIRHLATEQARLAAIQVLLTWSDAGGGGFYDDLGKIDAQPHLLPARGPPLDPSYYQSPMVDFADVSQQGYPPTSPPPSLPALPLSWLTFVRTHYGGSIHLRYPVLPGSRYNITIVYVTDEIAGGSAPVMLLANNATVHDWLTPQSPMGPVSFAIPPGATYGQQWLNIECRPQPLCSQEKNGCAIAEIWILRI